jgi:hypothetical protein
VFVPSIRPWLGFFFFFLVWRLGLLPDELKKVLAKHEHALADLIKRQALSPEHSPRCLPYS